MGNQDVAVIGGGTIGNFLAYQLSKRGVAVEVFEENSESGLPQHCSGLISISGLKKIGVWDKIRKEGLVLNYIRGANFVSIKGVSRNVYFDKPVAVVIDRIGYDQLLYNLAIGKGAIYNFNTPVKKINIDGLIKFRKNGKVKDKEYIVVADSEGARRNLIKNLPGVTNKGLLPALQIDVKVSSREYSRIEDTVELYFNVDDFFSWVIPLGEKNMLRIGVATNKISIPHIDFLRFFIRRKFGRFKIERKFGGIVVSGGPLKRFVWNKIIAVGDAAGHVKPTTGGGVVVGSIGALFASNAIVDYLEAKDTLDKYQSRYLKFMKLQYMSMLFARKTLNILRSSGVEKLLRLFPQVVFSNLEGDMDMQFEALLKLVLPFIPLKKKGENGKTTGYKKEDHSMMNTPPYEATMIK